MATGGTVWKTGSWADCWADCWADDSVPVVTPDTVDAGPFQWWLYHRTAPANTQPARALGDLLQVWVDLYDDTATGEAVSPGIRWRTKVELESGHATASATTAGLSQPIARHDEELAAVLAGLFIASRRRQAKNVVRLPMTTRAIERRAA